MPRAGAAVGPALAQGGWGRRTQHYPHPAPTTAPSEPGTSHLPGQAQAQAQARASTGGRWSVVSARVCRGVLRPREPPLLPPAVTRPTHRRLHPARCRPHTHRAMSQASWRLPAGADPLPGFPLGQVVA